MTSIVIYTLVIPKERYQELIVIISRENLIIVTSFINAEYINNSFVITNKWHRFI